MEGKEEDRKPPRESWDGTGQVLASWRMGRELDDSVKGKILNRVKAGVVETMKHSHNYNTCKHNCQ